MLASTTALGGSLLRVRNSIQLMPPLQRLIVDSTLVLRYGAKIIEKSGAAG